MEFKKRPIKQSGVIIRTEIGKSFFDTAVKNRILIANGIDIKEIMNGQARSAPFHYNVSARHRAGKLLKMYIPDTTKEKVKWNEFLVARRLDRAKRNPTPQIQRNAISKGPSERWNVLLYSRNIRQAKDSMRS